MLSILSNSPNLCTVALLGKFEVTEMIDWINYMSMTNEKQKIPY